MSNIEQRIICVAEYLSYLHAVIDSLNNLYYLGAVVHSSPTPVEPGMVLILQRDNDSEACKCEAETHPAHVGTTGLGYWTIVDDE